MARKVDSLNRLLTAREQLSNLLTYMDGKTGAEGLISKLLNDPVLLQALSSQPNQVTEGKAVKAHRNPKPDGNFEAFLRAKRRGVRLSSGAFSSQAYNERRSIN